jgi:hypothetical protein
MGPSVAERRRQRRLRLFRSDGLDEKSVCFGTGDGKSLPANDLFGDEHARHR